MCRAIVRASATLAPHAVRARWLEEWRAEIDAARMPPLRLLARTAGAPVDALSARWTTRTAGSAWRGPWQSDVQQTLRGLLRSPGHVVGVTVCLGVGIAVNVAVFSMVNTMLFRDLPGVRERDRIVRIVISYREGQGRASDGTFTPTEYGLLRAGLPAVPEIAAQADWNVAVAGRDLPAMPVPGGFVSGNYFDVFGTRPELGRLLHPADDVPGADPVVVLSHHFWRRYLGQRLDVIGQPLFIGGRQFTIVGVAPRGFMGIRWDDVHDIEEKRPQVFVAMNSPAKLGGAVPGSAYFAVFGRLASAQTIESASRPLQPLADAISAADPGGRPEARLVLYRGLAPNGAGEATLVILLVMAGPFLVLAISCANAANLQLARATGRARELVLRFSLGASRRQIVRLLMIEAGVLAVLAAGVGTLGSIAALRLAPAILPYETGVDARVLLFTLGAVGLIVLGAGAGPAILVTSRRTLKADRRRTRVRNALVISQVTASMLLLLAAALTTRTLQNISVGVPELAERIVAVRFNFGLLGYDDAKSRAFLREFTARLAADSRVNAVGVSTSSPAWRSSYTRYWLPGDAPEVYRSAAGGFVSSSYFGVMELDVRRGRVFRAGEELSAVVVDELFVQTHQLADPVGTIILVGSADGATMRPVEIVGVVENAMLVAGWSAPQRSLYLPMPAAIGPRATVLARTASPRQVVQSMTALVAAADANLPALDVQTLAATYREELDVAVILAGFAGIFGTISMWLAVAGIYAVVAYLVSLRTREIGVRMAIGARPRDVMAVFVRDAGRLIAWGIAIALAIGIPATWLLRALLYGLSPLDPASFAGTTLILLLVGLLAAIIPARRAARVDPLLALRAE